MSERKILPCPFCGKNSFQLGKKPFERRIGHDTFYCGFATHDCGVLGYTITLYAENLEEEHEVRENLIRKWNTRKPMEKVVEQLEEERKYSYSDFDDYVSEVTPCLDREYDDFFYRGIERAVKIVKAGGVDE